MVPLQSLNLMRESMARLARVPPWCGFQGQKAMGSKADLTSRAKVPRLEDFPLKKKKKTITVTICEAGTSSRTVFSQATLPTAPFLQKRKKTGV